MLCRLVTKTDDTLIQCAHHISKAAVSADLVGSCQYRTLQVENNFRVGFGLDCYLHADSRVKIAYSVVVSGSIDALQPLRSICSQ